MSADYKELAIEAVALTEQGAALLKAANEQADRAIAVAQQLQEAAVANLARAVAAEAERDALAVRLASALGMVGELADDVEATAAFDWLDGGTLKHPNYARRYERDMEIVHRARALLEG